MHYLIILLPLLVILLLGGLMYWAVVQGMKKRSKYSIKGLIGAEARVVISIESSG